MKSLGICLGASTITIVEVSRGESEIPQSAIPSVRLLFSCRHEGNPRQIISEALRTLPLEEFSAVAATGRKLCNFITIPVISEPEAIEYAFEYVNKRNEYFDALVSCGGETFMAYSLDKTGKISTVYTGNKCASGTGEFFLQQVRRMNLDVDEAIACATGKSPFKVAGRCSVFCKSDCTHALNRGEPKENVVAGLSEMVASKIIELLHKIPKNKIMVVGGVSRNSVVLEHLRRQIKYVYVPDEANYFEALGAALWALKHAVNKSATTYSNEMQGNQVIGRIDLPITDNRLLTTEIPLQLFKESRVSFNFLPSLCEAENLVTFKNFGFTSPQPYDECIIGLDVGSTTTKAVLIRLKDAALLGSVYLRTLGQPIEAACKCYAGLLNDTTQDISIVGLGVTGSGRQIAGLHALTKDIINEIIAHATAAAFFDSEVDTIFEIGGQDAKYTHLVNSVPCDYAMNEACSAGTGSFLEEACKETLGVAMEEISDLAIKSQANPNFNEQCAAFISGDIKTAIQEGIKKEDIVAGLVYSICMNYINRVKGFRPAGKKIFMQGGLCYIKAVPLAMASLIGKPIVVPPHPGLMGAFGVALEVRNRINFGISKKERFDLKTLAERKVEYGKSFVCPGESGECDRKCQIEIIRIEGKNYPFGGACDKYYNHRLDIKVEVANKDLVHTRQKFLFEGYHPDTAKNTGVQTVGINLSFLCYSLFPLYRTFFEKLGFKIVIPSSISPEGLSQQGATFCYPAAVAHGFFLDLINKQPNYIFLPQVAEIPVENAISTMPEHQSTCHILQAEPYYLKSAFRHLIGQSHIISPIFNFSRGYADAQKDFIKLARRLKKDSASAKIAYSKACVAQADFLAKMKEEGKNLLEYLRDHPDETVIVLFGRFYNAFCSHLNLNIPHKFSSRGKTIIPFEFLPYESEAYDGPQEFFTESLTWATGQMILRAGSFVRRHPQLFGVYITNFSCGPDSFLLTYFRQIMQDKPSLTLEIDSHTADAGVNTRIEAFLDIVKRYQRLKDLTTDKSKTIHRFQPARFISKKGNPLIKCSDNREYNIFSPKVHLLIPSMGDLTSSAFAATFERFGMRATAMGVPDYETLMLGRGNTSGKECLPLILCCGNLLKYLKYRPDPNEILLYLMPTVGGNCRFSQYNVFLQNLVNRQQIKNVVIFSPTSENGYVGFGSRFNAILFKSTVVSDVFDDIRNTLMVLARNRQEALQIFYQEWQKILDSLRLKKNISIENQLRETAQVLHKIPLKYPIREAKFVSLLGEIFARKEIFSRQDLVERLTSRGIIPRTASVVEWFYYVDHLVKQGIISNDFNLKKRLEFVIKNSFQYIFEKRIKHIIAESGLYSVDLVDIEKLIEYGKHFVPLELTGEPIIVMGAAISEVLHSVSGAISIGPFSCLPTQVTEAILSKEMNIETKCKVSNRHFEHHTHLSELPFLSVEVDGNSFSPVIEARLEAFCLQVERVHKLMQEHKKNI